MKKFLIMICFALISVCSVGCSAENSTKMYIETAQLTDEEKGLSLIHIWHDVCQIRFDKKK